MSARFTELADRAAQVITAIRARGSDASDLRDAAHEAHHALDAGVPAGKRGRESIHCAIARKRPGDAAPSEVMARAVKQVVCADLGVRTEGVRHWAAISCLEAGKRGIPWLPMAMAIEAIEEAMKSEEARRAADRVLALAAQLIKHGNVEPTSSRRTWG
jgi:hypothetical protein